MLIRFFLIISIINNFFAIPFSLNPVTFVRGKSHKRLRIKFKKKKKKKKTRSSTESTTSDTLKLNSSHLIQMLTKTK